MRAIKYALFLILLLIAPLHARAQFYNNPLYVRGFTLGPPVGGAWIGVFPHANPSQSYQQNMNTLEGQIGRFPALSLHYFNNLSALGNMTQAQYNDLVYDINNGILPVIRWGCGPDQTQPNGNTWTTVYTNPVNLALVDKAAQVIASLPGPVIITPGWEMNINFNNQSGDGNGNDCYTLPASILAQSQEYAHYFQAIVAEFAIDNTTNVQWWWNPVVGNTTLQNNMIQWLFPGFRFVDGIGWDAYPKNGQTFATLFGPATHLFAKWGYRPVIFETANCNSAGPCGGITPGESQAQYITDAMNDILPGGMFYPFIGGFTFFDSCPNSCPSSPPGFNWVFDGPGLTAYQTMSCQGYFGGSASNCPSGPLIVVNPPQLNFTAWGSGGALTYSITEAGFAGTFSINQTACVGILSTTPTSGIANGGTSTATASANGNCSLTISDGTNTVPLPAVVATPTPNILTVTPASQTYTAFGQTQVFTVTETGYVGNFTLNPNDCGGIVSFSPTTIPSTGGQGTTTGTAVANGKCTPQVTDTNSQAVNVPQTVATPRPGPLTTTPTSLTFTAIGVTFPLAISDPNYTGTITITGCSGTVSLSASSITGPSGSINVTSVANGSCSLSLTDGTNTTPVSITVSTTADLYNGCNIFQSQDGLHTNATGLTPAGNSSATTAEMIAQGASGGLTTDIGADGPGVENPINVATNTTPTYAVNVNSGHNGNFNAWKVPWGTNFKHETNADGHAIVVNVVKCQVSEMYHTTFANNKLGAYSGWEWAVGSPTVFFCGTNLNNTGPANQQCLPTRGVGPGLCGKVCSWPSAIASGLPILSLAIRDTDITQGSINHALALDILQEAVACKTIVWPATSTGNGGSGPPKDDTCDNGANAAPYGSWFRLNPTFTLSCPTGCPQAQMVVTALKTYGALIADTSGEAAPKIFTALTNGTTSPFNNSDLAHLSQIKLNNLQLLIPGSM